MESIKDDEQHDRQLAWAIAREVVKNSSPQNRELLEALDYSQDIIAPRIPYSGAFFPGKKIICF